MNSATTLNQPRTEATAQTPRAACFPHEVVPSCATDPRPGTSPAAAEAHSAPFCDRVRRQQLARREQPGSRSGAGPGRAEPSRTPAPGSAAPGASRAPSGDSPALDPGWAPSGG